MKNFKYLTLQIMTLILVSTNLNHAMEQEKPKNELWKALVAHIKQAACNETLWRTDAWEQAERARRDREASASCNRLWASSQESSISQQTEPSFVTQVTFDKQPTGLVIVPYTTTVLACIGNQLHRFDASTQSKQSICFNAPITSLVNSPDGSLCAILVMPEKDVAHIHFVNASKSKLEINNDIEPIPYHHTNEYEIGQEADFSSDARFLATISTSNSACIHNLKTNSPHAIIVKNKTEFPIFSVHFLKNSNLGCPAEKHQLAMQVNMHTDVFEVNDQGCQPLYTVSQKTFCKNLEYSPRQSAWLFADGLIVRIGNRLFAYNAKKELVHTFKIGIKSNLFQCNKNIACFLEPRKKEKEIRFHSSTEGITVKLANLSNKQILVDDSSKLVALSVDKTLMCVMKPETIDEKQKLGN